MPKSGLFFTDKEIELLHHALASLSDYHYKKSVEVKRQDLKDSHLAAFQEAMDLRFSIREQLGE